LTALFFLFPKLAPKGRFNKKMIRLFTDICKTLLENITDEGIFQDATNNFIHYTEKCPNCHTSMNLILYSDYVRNLVSFEDGKVIERRVKPKRFKCASCGKTHALLPDILIPYSPYSLRFKLSVLTAYFQRDTTVEAICQCFGIAVSTLYEWKKCLLSHKELHLGILINRKEPASSFLRGLLESTCLSEHLHHFFHRFAFSFMQRTPATASHNRPP
jgi:transposase-like protein